MEPENCFHPTTYDLGNNQVQCVDCLRIWSIENASLWAQGVVDRDYNYFPYSDQPE